MGKKASKGQKENAQSKEYDAFMKELAPGQITTTVKNTTAMRGYSAPTHTRPRSTPHTTTFSPPNMHLMITDRPVSTNSPRCWKCTAPSTRACSVSLTSASTTPLTAPRSDQHQHRAPRDTTLSDCRCLGPLGTFHSKALNLAVALGWGFRTAVLL